MDKKSVNELIARQLEKCRDVPFESFIHASGLEAAKGLKAGFVKKGDREKRVSGLRPDCCIVDEKGGK